MSKLTRDQIIEILTMRVDGYTLEAIGNKYGISKQRVQQLIIRVTDKGVKKLENVNTLIYIHGLYLITHLYQTLQKKIILKLKLLIII